MYYFFASQYKQSITNIFLNINNLWDRNQSQSINLSRTSVVYIFHSQYNKTKGSFIIYEINLLEIYFSISNVSYRDVFLSQSIMNFFQIYISFRT